MKKNFTGWMTFALIASITIIMSEQMVQAQGCGRGGGPAAAMSRMSRGGFGGGQQAGMMQMAQRAQQMQMRQRMQQMMRYQQQMAQKQQQFNNSQQSTIGNMNRENIFANPRKNISGNTFAKKNSITKSKRVLNPDSPKAKRLAKIKVRKEARRKKKEEALTKRKAIRAKRIAEFKQRQEKNK